MIEARILELIQQEVDGENTPDESGELHRYLSTSAEARALFESLRRLADSLGAMRPADPPAELAPSILAALRRGRAPAVGAARATGIWKYAYAAAAGLVLGILLAPMIREVIPGGDLPEPAKVMGTMAGKEQLSATGAIERRIAGEGVAGTLRLTRSGGMLQMQLELASTETIEAVLEYDARHWRLRGIEQDAEMPFHAADQRLSFTHRGRNRYTVMMVRSDEGEPRLLWSFYRSGALLHRVSYLPPDPAAAGR